LACGLHGGLRRREDQEAKIMDGKLALLYLIIIAMITFVYADDENVESMKHAISALAVARVHAAAE
jgi:hypothetical protein